MDRRYFVVGSGGYNGAGINCFLLAFPMLPKLCESEQDTLRLMNMVGVFPGFSCLLLSYVDMSRFLLTEQFLYIWNRPKADIGIV